MSLGDVIDIYRAYNNCGVVLGECDELIGDCGGGIDTSKLAEVLKKRALEIPD